jgi:hypothetical protein
MLYSCFTHAFRQTVLKLIVLFFALIILIVGPKIGMLYSALLMLYYSSSSFTHALLMLCSCFTHALLGFAHALLMLYSALLMLYYSRSCLRSSS